MRFANPMSNVQPMKEFISTTPDRGNGAKAQISPAAEDERWAAVLARAAEADGHFVYAVATTGVYCRPGCPARHPSRRHVQFFDAPAQAERAGFRPCKRCQPNGASQRQRDSAAVERACRLIERTESAPSIQALAAEAGLSPHHFHRLFKRVTGVTPRGYFAALRGGRARTALQKTGSVTEAIYEAGFNSAGRFYEAARGELGMKPSEYRAGGRGIDIEFAVAKCSLGFVLVAGTARGICGVKLGDDPAALEADLRARLPNAAIRPADQGFSKRIAAVLRAIENPAAPPSLPLDIRGTAFQHQVWDALRRIPPGRTATYTEIAAAIGRPAAVRAVAGACGANPVAVLVPCHRVLRHDGSLSGYRWGPERKRELLKKEGVAI